MTINNILTNMDKIFPKIISFLFNSKWTIPIIILLVILYFIWIGMKEKDKTNSEEVEA